MMSFNSGQLSAYSDQLSFTSDQLSFNSGQLLSKESLTSLFAISNEPSVRSTQALLKKENQNDAFTFSSFNVVEQCKSLYLEKSDIDHNTVFITTETGERIFNATYNEVYVYGRHDRSGSPKVESIDIFDYEGHKILTSRRLDFRKLEFVTEFDGQIIGKFTHDFCSGLYKVSNNESTLFELVSVGVCCCCRIQCSPCTICSFKILQASLDGKTEIGQMSTKWSQTPGAFCINFYKSIPVLEKALLLISGLLLNRLFFTQEDCCDIHCKCRIGQQGCVCLIVWSTIFVVMLGAIIGINIVLN